VTEQLRALPGVQEVVVSSSLPIERHPFPMGFRMEGDGETWEKGRIVQLNLVSPNLFEMVNLPILRGRGLRSSDRRGAPPVLVVNQSFVRAFLPNKKPIGPQIQLVFEGQTRWFTIVGVVPDQPTLGSRFNVRWAQEKAEAYLPVQQVAPEWGSYYFMVRLNGQSGTMGDVVREAVRSVDRNQPVSGVFTLSGRMERIIRRDVGALQAIMAVGGFGFLMAVLGIYGVVSYSVVERTHEIGVRMALGATKTAVLGWILRHAMILGLIGVSAGGLFAVLTTMGLSTLLFGVTPLDPATYLSVILILLSAVLFASLIPALKVTRIDPIAALRYE
jgi:putative ABC transport system permease protein